MDDLVVTILIFIGVVAVTTVLFGGWVFMSFVRGAWRLIDRGTNRTATESSVGRKCGNLGCRTTNPTHARFCRRCGTGLDEMRPGGRSRGVIGLRIAEPQSKIVP
jgi:ribosomal protein L40E